MESIKLIINNVIRDIQEQQLSPKEDMGDMWRQCVNKSVAKHTKASFLKKGILYVNTENPAWRYELSIKKEGIIKKIRTIYEGLENTILCISGSVRKTMEITALSPSSAFYRQFIIKNIGPFDIEAATKVLENNLSI